MLFLKPLLELCINNFVGLFFSYGGEQQSLSLGLLTVLPLCVREGLNTFAWEFVNLI
jgi:hypothetical protein